MSDQAIQQVLSQLRQLKFEAASGAREAAPAEPPAEPFATLLSRSIDQLAENQQTASDLRDAFSRGDPDVDLASVMIAGQKARVSFEAALQVRNRLVEAYREIQNMSI